MKTTSSVSFEKGGQHIGESVVVATFIFKFKYSIRRQLIKCNEYTQLYRAVIKKTMNALFILKNVQQ